MVQSTPVIDDETCQTSTPFEESPPKSSSYSDDEVQPHPSAKIFLNISGYDEPTKHRDIADVHNPTKVSYMYM